MPPRKSPVTAVAAAAAPECSEVSDSSPESEKGVKAEVDDMDRQRLETPAHFLTGLAAKPDWALAAYLRRHNIVLPKRTSGVRGRMAKSDKVEAILAFDREQRLEAESARVAAKKLAKVAPAAPVADSDSCSSSDESEESEESSSSEDEPLTPPPVRKTKSTKKAVKGKGVAVEQTVVKPTKRTKKVATLPASPKPSKAKKAAPAPKARKVRPPPPPPSSDSDSEVDQDGEGESTDDSDSDDQPKPSAEIRILLGELCTGNDSGLVRRKLKDTRLKAQLVKHLGGMLRAGKLSKSEHRDIITDYCL